jgi:hypothetical protein
MTSKRVFEPVPKDIKVGNVLPSKIFVELKRDAIGQPTKHKAGSVANSSRQLPGKWEYRTSLIVSNETKRLAFAVSGAKGHMLSTIDIEGAYLECSLYTCDWIRK